MLPEFEKREDYTRSEFEQVQLWSKALERAIRQWARTVAALAPDALEYERDACTPERETCALEFGIMEIFEYYALAVRIVEWRERIEGTGAHTIAPTHASEECDYILYRLSESRDHGTAKLTPERVERYALGCFRRRLRRLAK